MYVCMYIVVAEARDPDLRSHDDSNHHNDNNNDNNTHTHHTNTKNATNTNTNDTTTTTTNNNNDNYNNNTSNNKTYINDLYIIQYTSSGVAEARDPDLRSMISRNKYNIS